MKRFIMTVKEQGSINSWDEELNPKSVRFSFNPEEMTEGELRILAQKIINYFNSTLYPRELPRELVDVAIIVGD